MAKRLIFDVVYRDKLWHIDLRDWTKLTVGSLSVPVTAKYPTKIEAQQNAVDIVRCLWFDAGIPCRLVIHGKNGKIQEERTYPDVTPGRKG